MILCFYNHIHLLTRNLKFYLNFYNNKYYRNNNFTPIKIL